MSDIHDPCRANMAKADIALRAALDEIARLRGEVEVYKALVNEDLHAKNAHLKDELDDWRKEGEKLRADQQQLCLDIENLKAENERLKNEQMPMRLENERLKAERHTTKEMLEDVLKRHGAHYGLGRGGLGGAGQSKP